MSLFRVYVDGALFYHPQMSKLAITAARIEEDAENIDSMTLSAPFNHPYLSAIRPLASTIVCKKGDAVVFEGRALDNGTDFYNTHTWTCESCLAYLKDSVQPPYDYRGTLRGLLELFIGEHNRAVEEKKRLFERDFPSIGRETKKPSASPVRIGDGNWIGKLACVLKGSRIGDGVTVGTRAIVSNQELADHSTYVSEKGRIIV